MLDLLGTIVGLLYLWWEVKENPLMWVASCVMPLIYTVVLYRAGIYADCAMEVYYFLASIYGLLCWRGVLHRRGGVRPTISHTPSTTALALTLVTIALWGALWYVLSTWTDSRVPVIDALSTALSVVALWMLSRKYVEQWLVWLVVDAISAGLYIYKGIYGRALLYALYTALAVWGYMSWRRKMTRDTQWKMTHKAW